MRKRILFLCAFPPPFTGQTLATRSVFESMQNYFDCSKVNILPPNTPFLRLDKVVRLVHLLRICLRLLFVKPNKMPKCIYIVGSSSYFGVFRDLLLTICVRRFAREVIMHIHSGSYGFNFPTKIHAQSAKYLFSKIDKFIFLSESLAEKCKIIPSSKKYIVPNCVDRDLVPDYTCLQEARYERQADESLRVIYVSNFIKEKGFLDLIQACKSLHSDGMKIKCKLVGNFLKKSDEVFLRQLVDNDGYSQFIELVGPLNDRTALRAVFRWGEVIVLPTYYPVEAQPKCLIEAFSWGIPAVSCDIGGISDFVKDGSNGWLVNPRSPIEIVEVLKRYRDKRIVSEHSKAALETFCAQFAEGRGNANLREIFGRGDEF